MSQVLINHYLAELDRLRRVSGANRDKFHVCQFGSYKAHVVDLLRRVETVEITDAMAALQR